MVLRGWIIRPPIILRLQKDWAVHKLIPPTDVIAGISPEWRPRSVALDGPETRKNAAGYFKTTQSRIDVSY